MTNTAASSTTWCRPVPRPLVTSARYALLSSTISRLCFFVSWIRGPARAPSFVFISRISDVFCTCLRVSSHCEIDGVAGACVFLQRIINTEQGGVHIYLLMGCFRFPGVSPHTHTVQYCGCCLIQSEYVVLNNREQAGSYPDPNFTFSQLGVRIPTLLVSPWINRGTVLSEPPAPQKPANDSE